MTSLPDEPPLSEGVLRGIREFNERRYFESHETLEAVWRHERGQTKVMLHGMIQFAVGMLHTERANFKGATALLDRAIAKLQGLPPDCRGIDVAGLLAQARRAYEAVLALGPEGIARYNWDKPPEMKTLMTEDPERTEKRRG